MLTYKITGGTRSSQNPDNSGLIHTHIEVDDTTIYLSRFLSSKLWVIEIPHDNTIGTLGTITENFRHLDDETFTYLSESA